MLALDAAKFFTEPHDKGFPAILVRLPAVNAHELEPDHHGGMALPSAEGPDRDHGSSSSNGRAETALVTLRGHAREGEHHV
jgi:hypothetical protein